MAVNYSVSSYKSQRIVSLYWDMFSSCANLEFFEIDHKLHFPKTKWSNIKSRFCPNVLFYFGHVRGFRWISYIICPYWANGRNFRIVYVLMGTYPSGDALWSVFTVGRCFQDKCLGSCLMFDVILLTIDKIRTSRLPTSSICFSFPFISTCGRHVTMTLQSIVPLVPCEIERENVFIWGLMSKVRLVRSTFSPCLICKRTKFSEKNCACQC